MWYQLIKDKLILEREADNQTRDLCLITRDSNVDEIVGIMIGLRFEPGGENFRCIYDLDHNITLTIDWKLKPFSDILSNDLVINVIKDGKLGTFRHLRLPKDYDKVVSNEYFLSLGQTKDLSSLQWFDSKNIVANKDSYDLSNEKINLVKVNLYCSGLNFRNVLIATGIKNNLNSGRTFELGNL